MKCVRGRLAPSPSGRMHLGNAFSALLAWLSVRSCGGELVLRLEDLDRDRCKSEYSAQLIDDLNWLGLDWDISGEDYYQSRRDEHYQKHLEILDRAGLIYPCYCSRAERLAASAPHASDGRVIYSGACRNLTPDRVRCLSETREAALRLRMPDEEIVFTDGVFGSCSLNLATECGDIILRRSDGIFAYQLAVVVDDGLMGINQVVRGRDLIDSTAVQIHLHKLLGFEPPEYCHVPLLLAPDGKRLAKRERHLGMDALREKFTPQELIGILAHFAGLLEKPEAVAPQELVPSFSRTFIPKNDIYLPPELC